jgi:hypothetical protein
MAYKPSDPNQWCYTDHMRDESALLALESDRRHLISRDTSVINGIYAGNYGGEAIVVDYDKNFRGYDKLTESAIDYASSKKGVIDKTKILNGVYETVKSVMPYSTEGVEFVNKKYKVQDYDKVSLFAYINNHSGQCRHQALLTTTILQLLIQRGILGGHASVDRSIQWLEDGSRSGHAWSRYVDSSGRILILDVAQEFIGTLDQAQSREFGWNYLREYDSVEKTSFKPNVGMVAIRSMVDA